MYDTDFFPGIADLDNPQLQAELQAVNDAKTKPLGSLGRLEELE